MKKIPVIRKRWNSRNIFTNEVRLSISGSRTIDDERVKIIILEMIEKYKVTRITTHGEPGGVCDVGRKLCREKAIPLTMHYLNFAKLRGAFEHRSISVFMDTDVAVFIHDGISKGTQNEYALAKKMGIPCEYFKLDIPEQKESIGFPIDDNEWIDNIDLLNNDYLDI